MGILKRQLLAVLLLVSTIMAHADAGLPDPTRPADYSVTRVVQQELPRRKTEFSVSVIRISEIDRSAVVNGKMVRVGDDIGSAKIKEINAVEVVLDYERKLIVVPLFARGISKQYKTVAGKD